MTIASPPQPPKRVTHRNLSVPEYYEMALKLEKDSHVASNGALLANSYARKGQLGEGASCCITRSTGDELQGLCLAMAVEVVLVYPGIHYHFLCVR